MQFGLLFGTTTPFTSNKVYFRFKTMVPSQPTTAPNESHSRKGVIRYGVDCDRFCPKCGGKNKDSFNFCVKCGFDLKKEEEEEDEKTAMEKDIELAQEENTPDTAEAMIAVIVDKHRMLQQLKKKRDDLFQSRIEGTRDDSYLTINYLQLDHYMTSLDDKSLNKLSTAQLMQRLRAHDLEWKGLKHELIQRWKHHKLKE